MSFTFQTLVKNLVLPASIGVLGAVIFEMLHLPAAWIAGSLIPLIVATLLGVKIYFPPLLKNLCFILLGLVLCSGVSPETVKKLGILPISLALLLITVTIITLSVIAYLEKISKWDRATAFFSSIPGALSFVLALAGEYKGVNQRQVALFQSFRLVMLVVFLPAGLALIGFKGGIIAAKLLLSLQDMLILSSISVLFGFLAEKFKLPAGLLVGTMLMGAILYGAGTVSGEFPLFVQNSAFLLLALLIAERFNGATHKEIMPIFIPSLNGFLIGLAVTAVCSLFVAWLLKLPLMQVLLAFAPGGIEAMMILAFLFNIDPAYVGAHHLIRFFAISFILPLAAKRFVKKNTF